MYCLFASNCVFSILCTVLYRSFICPTNFVVACPQIWFCWTCAFDLCNFERTLESICSGRSNDFFGFHEPPILAGQGLRGFDKGTSLIVKNFKNLSNHFVVKLTRKYWVKLPTFHRSNSVTQGLESKWSLAGRAPTVGVGRPWNLKSLNLP